MQTGIDSTRFIQHCRDEQRINYKNRMKTKLLMMVAAVLALAGCSKDDEPGFDYEISLIHGTWRVSHAWLNGGYLNVVGTIYEDVFEPTYITFNSDGSYSGEGEFGYGSGTYKASGKTIVTYIGGEEYARYDILSLSENTAEAEMYHSNSPTDRLKFKVSRSQNALGKSLVSALGFVFGSNRGSIDAELNNISPSFSETSFAWRSANKNPVSLLEFDGDKLIRLYCKDQGAGLHGLCAEYGIPSALQYENNGSVIPQQWDNGKLKYNVFNADPEHEILGGNSPASRCYLTIEIL